MKNLKRKMTVYVNMQKEDEMNGNYEPMLERETTVQYEYMCKILKF